MANDDWREGKGGELRPLHGGRHGLPPDVVAFSQRERLLAAMAEVVAEHGYNKVTIAQVTGAASVSRRTFYEHFESKEECFIAAYDAVDSYLVEQITGQVDGEGEWADQVATTLTELLRFFASRPTLARLIMVEPVAVGEGMTSRHERTAERIVALLEPGRSERPGDRQLAEGIEEALAGGVMTLIVRRIVAGEAERLEQYAPGIVEFALAPYLGAEAARAVAARRS